MMITFSFYVQGDDTGFNMSEATNHIANAIERHKVKFMHSFTASRVHSREGLWRVSVRFNG